MKIPSKIKLQKSASNHLSDIDFKDFMNLYKTLNPNFFSVNNTTLTANNSLRCRQNLLERI